jgi:hypothetical protein
MRNSCNILAEKPKIKRPLGRTRCRWEDNIKIHVKKGWYMGVKLNHLV